MVKALDEPYCTSSQVPLVTCRKIGKKSTPDSMFFTVLNTDLMKSLKNRTSTKTNILTQPAIVKAQNLLNFLCQTTFNSQERDIFFNCCRYLSIYKYM